MSAPKRFAHHLAREEFLRFQEALFAAMDRDGDRRLSVPEFTDHG